MVFRWWDELKNRFNSILTASSFQTLLLDDAYLCTEISGKKTCIGKLINTDIVEEDFDIFSTVTTWVHLNCMSWSSKCNDCSCSATDGPTLTPSAFFRLSWGPLGASKRIPFFNNSLRIYIKIVFFPRKIRRISNYANYCIVFWKWITALILMCQC